MTSRGRAGAVLGVLALANLVGYAARNGLFATYPDLRERFHLHDAKLGLFATAFILPHALATLAFGWAGDRFDRRRVIAVGLAIASLAGAAGALAGDTTELVISRGVVGLGTAAIVPIANSIIGQLFPPEVRASRVSIFNLGILFGGVAGFKAGDIVGFPSVVVVLAVPGVVTALVLLGVPVPPHPGHAVRDAATSMSFARYVGSFFGDARALLRIRTLRWIIVSASAMAFAAGGFNAWLLDFLERDKHMTREAATNVLITSMIGAVGGIITGGRVSDWLRKRWATGSLWTIVIGMTASLPCAVACIELPAGASLYVGGIAVMFFNFWYHAPIVVAVDELAPRDRVVAAQGLVIFTMHLVGTAPSSWLVGAISDRWSLYTAMWVPTAMLVVAALAMAIATPTFARDVARGRGSAL